MIRWLLLLVGGLLLEARASCHMLILPRTATQTPMRGSRLRATSTRWRRSPSHAQNSLIRLRILRLPPPCADMICRRVDQITAPVSIAYIRCRSTHAAEGLLCHQRPRCRARIIELNLMTTQQARFAEDEDVTGRTG